MKVTVAKDTVDKSLGDRLSSLHHLVDVLSYCVDATSAERTEAWRLVRCEAMLTDAAHIQRVVVTATATMATLAI